MVFEGREFQEVCAVDVCYDTVSEECGSEKHNGCARVEVDWR